jgi:hypothetical protein
LAVVELRFTQGRLLQRDSELARVDPDASLTAGARELQIVRTRPHGWHYGVEDYAGEQLICRFDPLLVRRGGGLHSAQATVKLRGLPLRPRSWRFTTEAGRRIEVSSTALLLRSEDSIAQIPNAPIVLALGCWLIVNWENTPVASAADPASVPWGAGF